MVSVIESSAEVAALDLDQVRIDPTWALRVPSDLALRKRILPLCLIDGVVQVASVKPLEPGTERSLTNHLKANFQVVMVTPDSLRRALDRVYQRANLGHTSPNTTPPGEPTIGARSVAPSVHGVDHADAVGLCDELLQAALLRDASDIHLVPTATELLVNMRVDGQLELYRQLPQSAQAGLISRLKVLAGLDIAEKRAAQDGRITSQLSVSGRRLDMRVATLPTRYGERMTLRLLGSHSENMSLSGLGMRENDLQAFQQATSRPHGLVLLTGPTGSGKSTTLYVAIEQLLRTRGGNVITIEDPVEYEIVGASQVEIDSADKVNFSKALRSLLRHDPDVVMIGEIRDAETASIAVKASLTGHLVFSTLHTNTAAGVVTRLIDMGVEPFLVAATVRMSVAQRLVRRLCPNCRSPRSLTEAEVLMLSLTDSYRTDLVGRTVYEPTGCVVCAGRGYVGRIGLFELLPGSEELAHVIADGANEEALQRYARERQLFSLLDDGIAKLLDGTTTVSEVTSAVVNW